MVEAKVIGGNTNGLIPPTKMIMVGNEKREVLMPELSDRYISYHNKTYPLFYFREYPDERIIERIKRMDLINYSNNKTLVNKIEESERREAESKEREKNNLNEAIANDVYDTMKRRVGDTSVGINSPCSDSKWY